MNRVRNIAVFGGKFDPPHLGHQLTVFLALEKYLMDEVWIIPSFSHPFGYNSSDFLHRVEMCRIMAKPWTRKKVKVLKTEKTIKKSPVYTIDLISYFKRKRPECCYHLFIGEDNWKLKANWKDFDEIEKLCESIIIIGRGNTSSNCVSLPDISSSMIKDMLNKKLNPQNLLPSGILDYIVKNAIYSGVRL